MNLKTISFRLSFPHYNIGILKYGKLKDCQSKNYAVYHTTYGKRLSFCTACGTSAKSVFAAQEKYWLSWECKTAGVDLPF